MIACRKTKIVWFEECISFIGIFVVLSSGIRFSILCILKSLTKIDP